MSTMNYICNKSVHSQQDYICNECQTRYVSGPVGYVAQPEARGDDFVPNHTPPTGIKWNDGHTCKPVLMNHPGKEHRLNKL